MRQPHEQKFMNDSFVPMPVRRQVIEVTQQLTLLEVPVYMIGSNNLWIFINGKKEYVEYDYEEITNTSIRFRKNIPIGAIIEVLIFRKQ